MCSPDARAFARTVAARGRRAMTSPTRALVYVDTDAALTRQTILSSER
jgi:hypothetical protein